MADPVVCLDGYTYERSNIEEWFKSQSGLIGVPHAFTSPLTGEKLQSTILIRNLNLAKAIAKYTGTNLHLNTTPAKYDESPAPVIIGEAVNDFKAIESLQFSPWSLGKSITLEEHRSVACRLAVHADTVDWYEFIAFSAFPARLSSQEKPRALFKIEKTVTNWGGFTIGISPCAPDSIKAAQVKDFVDANCWYLDSNNWFHIPNGASVLVPWSTSKLRQGDTFGMIVPESGRICFMVNGEKKLDLKDTELPIKVGTQLFGFVALTGAYDRVRIIQDSPDDWKI